MDRHLFPDSTGNRHGKPKVGAWFDCSRIPGRAKSHTKKTKTWETYRLVDILDGHLAIYRNRGLDPKDDTSGQVADLPSGVPVLKQPRRLPAPVKPARGSWWDHVGVMAVVFTGLPAGDLVLPVRFPQGSGQWARLRHFLSDPGVWHRIDLVRVQGRKAQGGWRHYAHLMVLKPGYTSPSTQQRRSEVPTDRRAGVDGNVSNLAVVSIGADRGESDVRIEHIAVSEQQRRAAARAANKTRDRQKALDRPRRAANTAPYAQSVRQAG